MKKVTIISITFIIIFSIFNICNAAVSKNIKAKFTVTDIAGTNFKDIKISPYNSDDDEDDEERTYKIYLPTGYYVEGTSASFVADRNGSYPFTVYDGSYKKTFTYNVKNIDAAEPDKDDKKDKINLSYSLMYDYEKKQIFLNMKLDKLRTVVTPSNTLIANEVNYYIKDLKNNIPYDLTIKADKQSFDFKIIKSGEFYLLIYISPVNYNDYSTIVEYYGYNFTNNDYYTTNPPKDIYDDNGNYEVLVKSNSSQHIFNFNITGIDYRRPSVDIELLNNDTFYLEIEDDFALDYIITFDGKYVPIKNVSTNETFIYNHNTVLKYNGEYTFIVVDKQGNRTVEQIQVKSLRSTPRNHKFDPKVHGSDYNEDLFENIGLEYRKQDDETKVYENILPAYMNGKSPDKFSPDSPISRAEMVTIFCRLNNLPYDSSAHLKTKFTDIDNHWARDYISMGSSKKYVSGYKDKTFKPDNNVTRAEFCQMLTKISTYKSLLNALPASTNIGYVDIYDHWAEAEIIKIAGRNLMESNNNLFYPDKPITRGEVVHAINMLYGFNPSYLELGYINSLYSKNFNFQDIYGHKYYSDIIISVVGMFREKID